MSGLAAAVRLGMFGRKVLVLERHNAAGGLNSFYARGKRKYDVGLHALTNWVPEGAKGAPLVKLMRQLRIRREELDLCPQLGSRVTMAGKNLRLNNDYEALLADVAREFPQSVDRFRALDAWISRMICPLGYIGQRKVNQFILPATRLPSYFERLLNLFIRTHLVMT